jgi:hypothetical protein
MALMVDVFLFSRHVINECIKTKLQMLRSILSNCTHFENYANSPLFKVFLPTIQTQSTTVTRIYNNFKGKICVLILFLNRMCGS